MVLTPEAEEWRKTRAMLEATAIEGPATAGAPASANIQS
jgi:hypothetical protein